MPLSNFANTYDKLSFDLRPFDTMQISAPCGRVLPGQMEWNKTEKRKLSTSDSAFE